MHERFPQDCTSSVTLPIAWIKGSVSFPRGFPPRCSYEAIQQGCPTCHHCVSRSSAGKSWQCKENMFLLNGLRYLGDFGIAARPSISPRFCCRERLLLRCDGNPGNSFPREHGKDPSSRATRRKRGSSGCGRDPRASSTVETEMSGNFLSCSKGVKYLLEVPEVRCD